MPPNTPAEQDLARSKIEVARELLTSTKRNLQIVDAHLERLNGERVPLTPAQDVSSEHRAYWIGAVDADDGMDGIRLGRAVNAETGFGHPHRGIIRNQEDAAFVCTDIMVALGEGRVETVPGGQWPVGAYIPFTQFYENWTDRGQSFIPYLRLSDGNTGRSLITGMTVGPLDRDRGAVPFSYFSSIRPGLGSNVKNRLFSEFTIPRAGVVHVDVFNLTSVNFPQGQSIGRACVSLVGYKVWGG